MKKNRTRIRPRTIVCIASVLVIIVGYFIFLCCYSRYYTFSFFLMGRTDTENVRVECSPDNIVRVKSISEGTFQGMLRTLEVELESVGHGDLTVNVSYDDIHDDASGQTLSTEHKTDTVSMHVTFFGLIYNRSSDNFNGLWTVKLLMYALLFVLIVYLSLSFHEKKKQGEFTYQMVTLGGLIFYFSVFVLFSFFNTITSSGYNSLLNLDNMIYQLSNISTAFVYHTSIPFMLFCLLLSISNIQLVRREGFRVYNILGVLLGFLVIAGLLLMYFLQLDPYSYPDAQRYLLTIINTAVAFTFCYLESLMVSTIFCALFSTRYKIPEPMDYIIILGCAINNDGTPKPLLRSRIDRAIAFDNEQFEKWGRHAKFVPSGGHGSDEVISEAESMKRYLMEQGIPEERILKEDKSVNTFQNMKFSKKIIEDDSGGADNAKIAFSTTNYHVFRGYTIARRLRMNVKGLSAKTKLYFFPNAFLREFIGLLFEKRKWHLFFILSGVIFFALLYLTIQY